MASRFVLFGLLTILLGATGSSPSLAGEHEKLTSLPRSALRALGRKLFFDARFSQDGTVSCASCHRPENAFTDGKSVAQGVQDRRGTRNTPSLRNAAYTAAKFWDGRRPSLETQVLDPFLNPNEHGLRDHEELLRKLGEGADYDALVKSALGLTIAQVRPTHIAQALSAYVLSLKPGATSLDRYLFNHEVRALTLKQRRGLALFRGRAQCATCHHIGEADAPLTDGTYHSLALGFDRLAPRLAQVVKTVAATPRQDIDRLISSDAEVAALGRFVVTLRPADIGKFRTPSLRNVADTAPYMHDGSIASLEEAVERELYYRGKTLGRPLVLSVAERADLLAFLQSLQEVPTEQQR